MYSRLADVTLRTGEIVEAGVVAAPDGLWRDRLKALLHHKGGDWNWQVAELLAENVGVEAYFHILHRDGIPFSNIMTVELNGVGIFGHVWTAPTDRGNGAASLLMQRQMEFFHVRGGQALYLGTGYDSSPYHIYRRHGFEGVEPRNGVMTYFSAGQSAFEETYFAPGDAVIQPLAWTHWPTASALFSGGFPGVIRCAPLGLVGRKLTEGVLLPIIRQNSELSDQGQSRAFVLQKPDTGTVVGMAAWSWDRMLPSICVVDVYCHPNFWSRADELVAQLQLPEAEHIVAYVEPPFTTKFELLRSLGFREVAMLPRWIAGDALCSELIDVVLLSRDKDENDNGSYPVTDTNRHR